MQKNTKNTIKLMCYNALFASIYVVLVLGFGDFSFGFANGIISLRVAELLIALCCFNKKIIPGAILGCFCANLIYGNPVDIIVGTIQSAITVCILYYVKPKQLALFLGSFVCGIMIGTELIVLGFSTIGHWIILTTFIGEYICLQIGYIIAKKIHKITNIS